MVEVVITTYHMTENPTCESRIPTSFLCSMPKLYSDVLLRLP